MDRDDILNALPSIPKTEFKFRSLTKSNNYEKEELNYDDINDKYEKLMLKAAKHAQKVLKPYLSK